MDVEPQRRIIHIGGYGQGSGGGSGGGSGEGGGGLGVSEMIDVSEAHSDVSGFREKIKHEHSVYDQQ